MLLKIDEKEENRKCEQSSHSSETLATGHVFLWYLLNEEICLVGKILDMSQTYLKVSQMS